MLLYDLGGANLWLFSKINAYHSEWFDFFMHLATALGHFRNAFFVFLALVLLLLIPRFFAHAKNARAYRFPSPSVLIEKIILFAIASALTAATVSMVKAGLHLPRPGALLPPEAVQVLTSSDSPYSFPSGHAAFAMLFAGVFWPFRFYQQVLLLLVVFLVGISRVSLGVHFPVDVLVGYGMGGLCVLCAQKLLALLARKMRNS